jgi:hypothetical protein
MKFQAALVGVFASAASAMDLTPNQAIPITSRLGHKIMEKAEMVEPPRDLEQERDAQFVAQYWIKYIGCNSLVQIAQEGGGGDEGILYTQNLVRFALCPEGQCSSCSGGGQYVVNMQEFLQAYAEFKEQELEWICENIRENCYCNNANNEEYCQNECFIQQGMEACVEYEGEERFELDRYIECQEMEANNNNNNGNNNNNNNNNQNGNNQNGQNGQNGQYYWNNGQMFIGPYCSPKDGKSIHLGVYYDEGCSAQADVSFYANANYGQTLPYSSVSIVPADECMTCRQMDDDNNNNGNNNNNNQNQNNNNQNGQNNYYYYQDWEPTELCQQSYEMAARCETGMDIYYPDTTGCDYINNYLPRLETATRQAAGHKTAGTGGGGPAKAFAWVFGITTALFGAYAYFLYRKIKRGNVTLASQDGVMNG